MDDYEEDEEEDEDQCRILHDLTIVERIAEEVFDLRTVANLQKLGKKGTIMSIDLVQLRQSMSNKMNKLNSKNSDVVNSNNNKFDDKT